MANIKINDLVAYTDPVSTDVLAIVDVGNDITKKVSIADLLENAGTGSAAAPSFSFDGDNNTGIYRPAADQVALTAGGTQALLAESTGITIPGNLTVSGTTTTIDTTTLVVEDKNIEIGKVSTPSNTTADGGGITLKGASDKTITWVNSTGAWTFNQPTNFNDHVRIDSSGRLLVGTTTAGAYSNRRLTVATSSGTTALELRSATNGDSRIVFTDSTSSSDTGAYKGQILYDQTNDFMSFNTNGNNERLRISSDGKVGIGTTSPAHNLDISPASGAAELKIAGAEGQEASIRLYADQGDDAADIKRFLTDTSGNLKIQHYSGSAFVDSMVIDSSGNVSIGTSTFNLPSGKGLQVYDSSTPRIKLANSTTGTGSTDGSLLYVSGSDLLIENKESANMRFYTAATERMRIDSSGNVLVGTTDSTVYNNGDSDSEGIVLRNGEVVDIARKGDLQLTLNRQTNDGQHIGFFRSGSPKSYISTRNDAFCIDVNTSERLRIDSSGNVGIGLSNPGDYYPQSNDLVVGTTSGNRGISVVSATTGTGSLVFADGTGNFENRKGQIVYDHSTNSLELFTDQTERLRIDSSGRVLLGTTTQGTAAADDLTIATSGNTGITIRSGTSNSGTLMFADGTSGSASYQAEITYYHNSNAMAFTTNGGSERMRIDSSGRLLAGTTTSRIVEDHAGNGPQGKIQIEGTNSDGILSIISAGTADANRSGTLSLGRHRNGTIGGTPTLVQNGDSLGAICFAGGDGTDMRTKAAKIVCEVDGTPGSNDMPGRLMFSTTADGASNPTERMRIDSSGNVGIGTSSPSAKLDVSGVIRSSGSTGKYTNLVVDSAGSYIDASHFTQFRTNGASSLVNAMRIDSSGRVGIGRTSASSMLDIQAASGRTQITLRNVGNTADTSTFVAAEEMTSGNADLILAARHSVRFFSNLSEKMRIESSGRVKCQAGFLYVQNSASGTGDADGLALVSDGNADKYVWNYDDTSLRFGTNNTERMRIDNSGRLLVGTSTSPTAGNGQYAHIVIQGYPNASAGAGHISLQRGQAAFGANNQIGLINFGDNTGASYAGIECYADADSGTNDYPGRLMFSTTADGASSPTERLRILSDGTIATGGLTATPGTVAAGSYIQHAANAGFFGNNGDAKFGSSANNPVLFQVNGSEKARIDTSGRLLVGTTAEGAPAAEKLTLEDSGNCGITIRAGTTSYSTIYFSDASSGTGEYAGSLQYGHSDNSFRFGANSLERMRIGSNGSVRMGADPNPSGTVSQTGFKFVEGSGFVWATQGANSYWNTSTDTYLNFRRNGSQAGSIVIGASSVAYNTSSDYRLKENVVDLDGAITRVKQLAPKRFNFIADSTTTVEGFLAHEAQSVVPECATGTKDEVDDDGNAVMQGIDQSKLVPLLTAALQEAITKIETLETKVAALEAG